MTQLFAFLTSTIIAVLITPVIIRWYTKHKWLDDPAKNNHPKVIHTKPLPRGGGIVIFVSIVLAALFFLPLTKHMMGILLGATLLMLMGFWDDLHNPSPLVRFGIQVAAALMPIAAGIGIAYVTNPFGGIINLSSPQIAFQLLGSTHTIWVLSDLFALIWIVWCMNIVNFSKGLDGQMPGYVAISAFFIALLSLRFGTDPTQFNVTTLSLIVSGAFLGFLFFNRYPQKIMPGFGASTLAGFFLAVLSILSGAKLATLILVLAVPMIDAAFVIFSRLSRGKSPFLGDRTHLHHKLMDLGWGKRRIAAFYWGCAFLLGMLALRLNSEGKVFTIVLVAALLIGFFVWFRFFMKQLALHDRDSG